MANTQSQAATFFNDEDNRPKKQDSDSNAPQVPFGSALVLTREQEKKMVNWAMTRKEDMERELGRNLVTSSSSWFAQTSNQATINTDRYTWMGKRSLWELTYNNQLWWRKWIYGANSIFNQSNLSSLHSHRITCQMIAQAVDYFFGTDPWFATEPLGSQEVDLADLLNEFAQFKADRNDLVATHKKGIEGAFVRGEAVAKTTYEVDEVIYEQFANVLIDQDGKYILDANGDWITDKDKFVDQMADELDPQTGKPIPGSKQPTGVRVLRKDMTTPEPPEKNYESKKIMRRSTSFKGAKSDIVYWQDLLVPETAAHIQRGGADIVIHLSDVQKIKLIDLYKRRGMTQTTAQDEFDEYKKALSLLEETGGSGSHRTALKQARPDIGESIGYVGEPVHEPIMEIAECYMTYDANEDGIQEEIVCVIDVVSRLPLFYDYLPNVTPDGLRPFSVYRAKPVEGRWYGIGAIQLFERSQKAIDLMFNRWNFAQSGSGRVTFWAPQNTSQGEQNPSLVLNSGLTYTLLKGKTAEETLSYVTLPEVKGEDLFKTMEYLGQLVMSESGVASANDSAAAGLDTTKTATGINNIQTTNTVSGSFYWGSLEEAISDCTKRNVVTEFANADPIDVLRLFNGDHTKMMTLLSEDAEDLEINVSILLTRAKNQQLLQNALTAINSAQQYFQSPVPVQHRLVDLYRDVLRSLEFDDADELIVPLDAAFGAMAPQPQPGQQPPDAAGQPDPNQSAQAPTDSAPQAPAPVQPVKNGQFYGLGQAKP